MSTASLTAAASPQVRAQSDPRGLRIPPSVNVALLLSIAGLFAISSSCAALWAMWKTDPLKSIGALVPIVSLVLILRVWRSLEWETEGSWWGLAILAATIAVVHLRDQAVLELVLSPSWSIVLPPVSLVAIAYTAGAVLLFGGRRLLRAAWFPVALMWFVNPVPHFFNQHVDLPLQHASAMIARSLAHALGQPLTPEQLSLMFTPKFGMFIAPGCNGIRGAVTMGLIALVAGYLYRLRPGRWALLTIGAVLLGYLFNFVRLCGLVFYYVIALRHPWLQDHAAMGDYILGASLFFVATIILFVLLSRWNPQHDLRVPPLPSLARSDVRQGLTSRCVALALVIALGSVSYARALVRSGHSREVDSAATVLPQSLGNYRLQREWNETLVTGSVVFHWGDYAPLAGGPVVSLGISPALGAHDTLICHAARGEEWLWHGPLQLQTPSGVTSLSASLFNNGATQYLEAASICTAVACNQSSTERRHLGLIYSRPAAHDLLTQNPERPVPILLRVETTEASLRPAAARTLLTQSLANFLSGADLVQIAKRLRDR
ncbi:MAG TPA: exosortase J [Acidobacteriaceae bacterium]